MSDTMFTQDGFGALATQLGELGARRVLVISGGSRRFVDAATAALEAFAPAVFDGARVHVPVDVVERAGARLVESGADTIVAIGGGSAIGLGKVLRLQHGVRFVAVPTTYAGSEMTDTYGITHAGEKQTGRDPRVRPDLVVYDVSLAREMPVALTAQSLLNAFAHVASVVATGSLDDTSREEALAAAREALLALEDLLLAPRALVARAQAARAASACAIAFDRGKPGAQHALAHLLGGALGIEHAPLHAILLPQFLAHLREAHAAALHAIERAVDRRDLDAYVHDLLVRAGAPTALTALGAAPEVVRVALATRPELPQGIALDAMSGLRPPGRGGRIMLGDAEAVVIGTPPGSAQRIVLALHGRGSEAGTIARRYREIVGLDPATSIVGLRAEGGADRWYGVRYGVPGAGSDPEVLRALGRVDAALAALRAINPVAEMILAGFSQGACLALEYAARRGDELAAVIAPCGARIGRPEEWSGETLRGVPVLLGASADDRWIAGADLEATARWFRAAGASVKLIGETGDRHEITARQRLRARELVAERPHPRGSTGFGNTFESQALLGAIPDRQNTPRLAPYGLYPEQLNGTGFTAPRAENLRTWCYRVRPSAQRGPFVPVPESRITATFDAPPAIDLCGFAPLVEDGERDFVDGLVTLCGAGDARLRRGYAVHRYAANRSMNARAFYSADGDLLILPELGALTLLTELGPLDVAPGMLAIVPRGIAFSVLLHGERARGYVAEPFGRHFGLPDRGPIGANGLADARHFRAPAAWYEDRLAPDFRIVGKLGGRLHEARQDHSPFDVVGWHGNYAPVAYDLADFSPVANVAFDHGDPSVYTVVSAPLDEHGTHTLDLVVFPPRMDATTGTFRPPFFHRNPISEINGIIREQGRAPFQPGCAYITPACTAHGVSGRAVARIRQLTDAEADAPVRHAGSLWFQLESALAPSLTPWAEPLEDWAATWGSHRSYFE